MNSGYGNAVANKPLSDPGVVLKLSMMTFLVVQAIRQLILINGQASGDKPIESRAGQVATWFTITLTLVIAAVLATSPLNIKPNMVKGVTFAVVAGVLGSGAAMLYDAIQNKGKQPEPNRLWFSIAHIIFGLLLLGFFLYSSI